jgi:poly-gamma-glutamate synthesis protein (capsule biosynthesis protein)
MSKASSKIGLLLGICILTIVTLTILFSFSQLVAAEHVTLIAGGDVEWSRVVKSPDIYYQTKKRNRWERLWYRVTRKMGINEGDWIRVPYLASPQSKEYLENEFNCKLETSKSHHINAIKYALEFSSIEEGMYYPFQQIRPILLEADIAFVNLETPLSDYARYSGAFRTPTAFAKALKWAGIDIVSTANNHALDAEGAGLIETLETLSQFDIGAVGTGRNLAEARQPYVINSDGVKIAFFGYSQFVNGGKWGFALPDRSGVVPLDPFIIKEDIQSIRDKVNFIILSFHWGWQNKKYTHSKERIFAHSAIDAGADVILGHHSHVPRGIEVYKGKVIIYSLGNFIFGHNHDYWKDNYLTRLTLSKDQIEKLEVIPISGKGNDLAQPRVLKGESAHFLLSGIKTLTEDLNTEMQINGDIGVIKLGKK